ncbi:hypothetical protein POX_f08491 [Penicillium oxalicum]|uniref:Uncharacterized protein n=1 Tax=Penicillium oxalicum (strain 114-2 / CGMCC 5302) TaxID=933388 RepID=S8ATK9_PENO1|nr:hypothetical protein POX_f08491 [Penicillium oxalicum]EPS29453.1 hypothetical protein PDE_04402 [Penicillium oxalicum 114-2]KAI2788104.1 hypothetical protein POX_f08491 [Penicillium oxalicum]
MPQNNGDEFGLAQVSHFTSIGGIHIGSEDRGGSWGIVNMAKHTMAPPLPVMGATYETINITNGVPLAV